MAELVLYPGWRYHRTKAPVLCQNEEEFLALGPEYARRIGGPLPEEKVAPPKRRRASIKNPPMGAYERERLEKKDAG